ncbi:MAG: FtsW/RodA/SpoVE family cell cycle protein [Patescibacteria group bacterium]|nr:FtsW/RodA/SpoVE family cell cycle protein [Patescibacteria group bacterium]MDD5121596.1 FtsW/RodA/SpoVE family cell cycle protein [Patescibacteria group bacterium]MDD5396240.1 FtsW/RodA/SpoVE family cell cycle protein [Patescibacteria group bacterium]
MPLILNQRFRLIDWGLIILIFLIVVFGLIVQYDLSFNNNTSGLSNFTKQLIYCLIGFILIFILSQLDFRYLKSISYIFYGVILLALVAVLLFGKTFHGVKGWLSFGIFNFQLVELAKLASIIALATFWQKTIRPLPFKRIILSLVFVLPPIILVALQPDFGSALVLFLTWLGIIVLVDNNPKHLVAIFLTIVLVLILMYFFVFHQYQRDRISTLLNPGADPLGRGYQTAQSAMAIGSGGWWGRGLSLSAHGSLSYLPAGQTDFIFAAIAERAGFLGCLIVFGLFFLLFSRLNKLVQKIYDNFAALLTIGILINLVIHFVINVGMNLGLLPVIGVPLPLLSYGGSYLLVTFIFIGLIQSISVHRLFIAQEKDLA